MPSISQVQASSSTHGSTASFDGPIPVRRLNVASVGDEVVVTWELSTEAVARGGLISTPVPIQGNLGVPLLELKIVNRKEIEVIWKDQKPPAECDIYLSVGELGMVKTQMGGSSGVDGFCHYNLILPSLDRCATTVTLEFSFVCPSREVI